MKKIFPVAAFFVLLASCSKDLNQKPISAATSLTFYASNNDFLQAVNAVYANLRTYPDRILNLSETRSDNLYAVSVGGVRDWEGINSFHKTIASNPYIQEAWNSNFNGIYKANTLLDQLQKNGQVITPASLKTRIEAEARFLRAFYYFGLVRLFGKVPVVDHPLTATEALSIARSPVADVYNLIISDLRFAGDNLPDVYAAADKGRATKWAAKGLLALVYMTRSGPTYSIDGPGLGLSEWSQAAGLLNEIIASNRYSLVNSYADIFSYTNENNTEVLFDVQYLSGSSPLAGATFPSLLVPDSYFQSLGKVVPGTSNLRPLSEDLLRLYEPGEVRRTVSVHTGYTYNGEQEKRSFFKKYLDIARIPANMSDWPINFIVLRYTDVLLMKAECVLHGAAGSQALDVDAVVNRTRQRAGLATPLVNVTMNQLMDERRKEFAAEGLRWFDLIRNGNVETVITAWIASEDIQRQIQPFQKNYIIYPIPQSELDVKQGLYTQNAGY